MSVNPLFIALKTQYFNDFALGVKKDELRLYGKRWNEKSCQIGRAVILSKGYGMHSRMNGIITAFKHQAGHTFGSQYQASILAIYGSLDVEIAVITIKLEGQ